jgi:hypothetical protein
MKPDKAGRRNGDITSLYAFQPLFFQRLAAAEGDDA